MARTTGPGLPAGVRELRRRIEYWRRTRERRTVMPAELWREAVALARRGGVYAVARAVGIDFGSLRRRMAEAGAVGSSGPDARSFVELSGAQILGAASSAASGAVVELSDRDGNRLTVRLAAGAGVDSVAALIRGVAGVVAAFKRPRA